MITVENKWNDLGERIEGAITSLGKITRYDDVHALRLEDKTEGVRQAQEIYEAHAANAKLSPHSTWSAYFGALCAHADHLKGSQQEGVKLVLSYMREYN